MYFCHQNGGHQQKKIRWVAGGEGTLLGLGTRTLADGDGAEESVAQGAAHGWDLRRECRVGAWNLLTLGDDDR